MKAIDLIHEIKSITSDVPQFKQDRIDKAIKSVLSMCQTRRPTKEERADCLCDADAIYGIPDTNYELNDRSVACILLNAAL